MTIQDDSDIHATLAGSEDASDYQDLPRGSTLGRYVIIEPIGSGGMGIVYRAYDPQLNRGVALKILSVKHADLMKAESAKARLIREAQALAQLSHPNVVAVHDAGIFEDDVFIAMELVEGKTLNDWMKEEKRSVKEILEVMVAAGRGLSAAHKAGLIHRDFKPGNVIVGDDDRVRVLDFGLARAADQEAALENKRGVFEQNGTNQDTKKRLDYGDISSDYSPNLLQSPLTHAGGVLGTPFYMAPEQHLGIKTDERTDQFGYCVVLYEALYGKRPFFGKSIKQLKREVIKQQLLAPGDDSNVPVWMWHIIRKGLSVKPKDRYASIDELIEDLDRNPEEVCRQKRLARRQKVFLISLLLLTIVIPSGVWYGLRYRTVQLCKEKEREIEGVWDETTKARVQKAFLATAKSFSQETWDRVNRIVDRYIEHWAEIRNEACEARLIRSTQSAELFDLRMNCLKKRIRELNALVRVFVKADVGVVEKAVQASASLEMVSLCADEETLRAPYPPPKTIELKKVARIREKLADVEAFSKTGKYKVGLDLAKELGQEADEVSYRPVQAETLYWLGYMFERAGEYKMAETTLAQAANAAGDSRDGLLAAKAIAWLARVVGYNQARHEEGLSLGRMAEVVLRLGGGDDRLRSLLLNIIGIVFDERREYTKALGYYLDSLRIREKNLGPDHSELAHPINNIGVVYWNLGKYDKAIKYYRKALALRQTTLGPDHPLVATTLSNMGLAYWKKSDYVKALDYYRRSLTIRIKALGPEHPLVATAVSNMGHVFASQGNYDKARQYLAKSLLIREKVLGRGHPVLVWSLSGIGSVFVDQGLQHQALESFERAVAVCAEKTCDPDPYGRGLFGLARALVSTGGNKERAIKLAKQAKEVYSKTPRAFWKELSDVEEWLKKQGVKTVR